MQSILSSPLKKPLLSFMASVIHQLWPIIEESSRKNFEKQMIILYESNYSVLFGNNYDFLSQITEILMEYNKILQKLKGLDKYVINEENIEEKLAFWDKKFENAWNSYLANLNLMINHGIKQIQNEFCFIFYVLYAKNKKHRLKISEFLVDFHNFLADCEAYLFYQLESNDQVIEKLLSELKISDFITINQLDNFFDLFFCTTTINIDSFLSKNNDIATIQISKNEKMENNGEKCFIF